MKTATLMSGLDYFKRLIKHPDQAARVASARKAELGSKILVVDDSPTICAILGRMLELEGYAVSIATDGESAIEMAHDEPPTLIFLDIVLPGMNGFGVLRALRQLEPTSQVPVILLSGNVQATEQHYAERLGADDFIGKPFGSADIRLAIDRLVGKGRLALRSVAEPEAPPIPWDQPFLVPQALRDKVA